MGLCAQIASQPTGLVASTVVPVSLEPPLVFHASAFRQLQPKAEKAA